MEEKNRKKFEKISVTLSSQGRLERKLEITSLFMKKQAFFFSPQYSQITDAFSKKGLPLEVDEEEEERKNK